MRDYNLELKNKLHSLSDSGYLTKCECISLNSQLTEQQNRLFLTLATRDGCSKELKEICKSNNLGCLKADINKRIKLSGYDAFIISERLQKGNNHTWSLGGKDIK